MMRFIAPIILIGISIAAFFTFARPFYNDIGKLRGEVVSYDEALNNSKMFRNEEDKLTQKYNSISKDDLTKIQKLLPDNIDNIRLILEIEQIALPYGMVLKDIKYSATDTAKNSTANSGATVQGGGMAQSSSKDYGIWDLEFSTTGTYSNFLNFTKDLESNLRIVDISSVQFSSGTVIGGKVTSGSPSSESYKYDFKIKTYWLKS